MKDALDWLDSRTGYRGLLHRVLDERLPHGTGWLFTTGSVVMVLLAVQFATGVVLAMYYVPSPALAYDSVRYITDTLPFGALVRGLHFWGASFLVVAAVVHLLRVFLLGSYKAPREVTWITGVVLLLIVLGFALSGYLLPWDQRAYWATTVTINVARSTPLVGETLASVLRGGGDLGALTLGRWYSAHVLLLPMAIVVFVVAHVALMRRHGISGPIVPREGPATAFFPWHVIKDTVMTSAVLALLLTAAYLVPAHLDEIANPADTSYVPRPEWYFLSLFQLLKLFPGPLEPIGTLVVPGLVVGFLFLIPFLDRGGDRRPFGRARRAVTGGMAVVALGVAALTLLGLRDMPANAKPDRWSPRALAGHTLVTAPENRCAACHVTGGPAPELPAIRVTRDEEWLLSHLADPVALAPGVRPASDPAPPPLVSRPEAQAIVAYLRRVRAGAAEPDASADERHVAVLFAGSCVSCHRIDGDGGDAGPDLSQVGARRSEDDLRRLIADPRAFYERTIMPAYGTRLAADDIASLARFLAARR